MTDATTPATFRGTGPRADGNERGIYNRALAVANKAKRYATTTFAVDGEVRKTTGNGDVLAAALAGHTPEEAVEICEGLLIAARVAVPAMGLTELYSHLNPGMARMNAANRVRGAMRKGTISEEAVLAHAIADTPEEGEEPTVTEEEATETVVEATEEEAA